MKSTTLRATTAQFARWRDHQDTQSDFGEVALEAPRDRNGSYEPKIIGKGQTRFTGFDHKIVSMYARGMSTREMQGSLAGDLPGGGEPDADFQCH